MFYLKNKHTLFEAQYCSLIGFWSHELVSEKIINVFRFISSLVKNSTAIFDNLQIPMLWPLWKLPWQGSGKTLLTNKEYSVECGVRPANALSYLPMSQLCYRIYPAIRGFCFLFFVLLFYVHGKHLRSCRDGQLT